MKRENISITIDGVEVKLSVIRKDGAQTPLVFLHGFGSTKEDYADLMRNHAFNDRNIIAYDAPGFGESECSDLSKVTIPFLVKIAEAVLKYYGINDFHISGHSMGGLTALMLLDAGKFNAKSFINIEGNVSPEDCFLSRQIIDFPSDNPDIFFAKFIARMRELDGYSNALYAANLKSKVTPEVIKPIFGSMVELSDNGGLMDKFLKLTCGKIFVYGDENSSLSYLRDLEQSGVVLSKIPMSSHFPMYSNPPALWKSIHDFIEN